MPRATDTNGDYGPSYWRERSCYRKFPDYESGLVAGMRWYTGLVRMFRRRIPAGGLHLDAGCGHGALVHLMRRTGWDSYGFDRSSWMIQQAQAFAPVLQSRLAVGDIVDRIPFDRAFDVITCLEVLEHLESADRALANLREALAPRGRLVITTPNLRPRIPGFDPVAADPTHVNVQTPGWWEDALRRAGLVPVFVTTYMAIPYLWRFSGALSIFIRMGRRAGPGTLILAGRPAAH